jgi:hypothetical protein
MFYTDISGADGTTHRVDAVDCIGRTSVQAVTMRVFIPKKSANPLEDIKRFFKRDYYQCEDIYVNATIAEYNRVVWKCLNGFREEEVYDDLAYKYKEKTKGMNSDYWTGDIEKYLIGTANFITPRERSNFIISNLRDPMIVAAIADMLIQAIRNDPMEYDFTPLGKYLLTKDEYVKQD